MDEREEWRPGSFTKNYSWGPRAEGLRQLHEAIRIGFDGEMQDVPRALFQARIVGLDRPYYVPMNFFLLNRNIDGVDHIIADELVFQALIEPHTNRFDMLGLYAFYLSYVGHWTGAKEYQARPALWANHYITDRVARELNWDTSKVSADDIEQFVSNDRRYTGKTSRKLATNLNYLLQNGRLDSFADERVSRWWVDALYLTLDRAIDERRQLGVAVGEGQYESLLRRSKFEKLAGKPSLAKQLAVKHLVALYRACGGIDRFVEEKVRERTLAYSDVEWLLTNNPEPQAAVHFTNPDIVKTIPRSCAMLARYYGFDVIDMDELSTFDPEAFVRRHTKDALAKLKARGVKPTMTSDQLHKITREE